MILLSVLLLRSCYPALIRAADHLISPVIVNNPTACSQVSRTLLQMERPDTTADYVAMLLSTDWFFPYWPMIGLEVGDERACFKEGCREIVKELMAGAEQYYDVAFTADHLAATRHSMLGLARQCNFSSKATQRIDELCTPKVKHNEMQTTAWMFRMILMKELLYDEQLDANIRELLLRAHEQFASDNVALERCCVQSSTEWDIYTRSLTPDLPACLSDFVSVALIPEAQLDFVFRRLSGDQRSALLNEYRAAKLRMTGRGEDELPDTWP